MEYFVDEMPRDCASCKHYHMNCADGYSCSKLRKEIHPNFSEGIGYRHQDCPLQSLSDYTKQVRKEVLSELRNMLGDRAELIDFGNGYAEFMFTTYDLQECSKEILDQLQGESKSLN